MTHFQLTQKLSELRSLPAEMEVVEFKEAKTGYDFTKLGRYFSALCNEANLMGLPEAWLVFGIENKNRSIVGSQYRFGNRPYLDKLKGEVAGKTTNRITFIEIYELDLFEGRVVMFQIPAAPKGLPVGWDGHYYGREGEELSPLNTEEFERIRRQALQADWSAEICLGATLEDLDPKARENYKSKFPDLAADVDTIPGSVENVIRENAPEELYRNPFLVTAMFNLKMVDTIGSGIRRMFNHQRSRFFPMPDYDLSGGKVKVTVTGKVLDMNFVRTLTQNPDLNLEEIVMLDKVQKQKPLLEEELKLLRGKGLVEGKKPNIIISAKVARFAGQKATYTRNKAFTNEQYFDWIIQGIKDHDSFSRQDIEQLIWDKLSDLYTEKQKKVKINNLISALRIKGKIKNIGNDFNPKWVMTKL